MATLQARDTGTMRTGWDIRHNMAVNSTTTNYGKNFESPIVAMLKAWNLYAADHRLRYESPIGEDYVLGPAWQDIGEGIRTLLNGELGRLDGGTLDRFIIDVMEENGIDTSEL